MDIGVIVLVVLLAVFLFMWSGKKREGLSGYGVTSALAFNNRMAYCQPGNEQSGGAWSGGCFLPHDVIL